MYGQVQKINPLFNHQKIKMYVYIHVPYEHFSEYPSDGEVLHQNHFEANVGAPGSVERGQFTGGFFLPNIFIVFQV